MEINEKLKKANSINDEIANIKSFINLCKEAQTVDEKNAKGNELSGVNRFAFVKIEAYICTGSQSPAYSQILRGDENIKVFVNNGIDGLSALLREKENALKEIFAL